MCKNDAQSCFSSFMTMIFHFATFGGIDLLFACSTDVIAHILALPLHLFNVTSNSCKLAMKASIELQTQSKKAFFNQSSLILYWFAPTMGL